MIPTIDISNPSPASLREACRNTGFFYLSGHSIPQSLVDAVLSLSADLFALEVSAKTRLSDPIMSRGYTAMGEETLDPTVQKFGDTKEGYYIAADVPRDSEHYDPSRLIGPNIWPDDETGLADPMTWKQTMEKYFSAMNDLGLKVVRLIALSLNLPEDHFDAVFTRPMAALRLLHYAPVQSNPNEGVFGCGAHSDYGMITILLVDETMPGLQIFASAELGNGEKKVKEWIDVPPVRGSFVVNIGDMLERWTGGLYKSTLHRVLTSGKSHRYSAPFFYEPNFDTAVAPLECCFDEMGEVIKQYPPVISGEYLLSKYTQTHSDFKPEDT
uniref:Fe2OG dioxygenase domain-containing protein n=1 Tax=Corethron hystrix TaxID=216773 RepID=A0A6U5LQR2_9STRA|mmetsp:Transcript_6635/g.14316  ORF Transcript_6635/g.14316 Transcript_6635/m.14316 type:complete len:327 (+) Transcript_6635:156-1136(+)|eukprot:CAMPEP_0113307920 /NCGR_PEP_ID=MMETSP0010_2-20120614/6571_1 /TAXON_ID=216773 ORGANISM="Corethron hystrix, Strain 308" /NCGR_SAMPLE_ID=MMETSP0010_2 /ASSEMBLY_ACC=CAM_ASM_000155 /LENGTH=326 /DNA_ID=CAMNT_0000162869 /DNA_START=62 /DNA_END=1042 /DNA_ORIENTATION=+ /assembly_acc=CAM_ASM_000155